MESFFVCFHVKVTICKYVRLHLYMTVERLSACLQAEAGAVFHGLALAGMFNKCFQILFTKRRLLLYVGQTLSQSPWNANGAQDTAACIPKSSMLMDLAIFVCFLLLVVGPSCLTLAIAIHWPKHYNV